MSTNVIDWANLGTINLEAGMSLSQHFSLQAGGRFNPWTFYSKKHDQILKNQQETAYLGFRYWPWYVNSGWWLSAKGQYSKTSRCGVWRPDLENGAAFGGGISLGYTLLLGKHFNLDFGLGAWAGKYTEYVRYECPDCTDIISSGPRGFIRFDDVNISFSFVF